MLGQSQKSSFSFRETLCDLWRQSGSLVIFSLPPEKERLLLPHFVVRMPLYSVNRPKLAGILLPEVRLSTSIELIFLDLEITVSIMFSGCSLVFTRACLIFFLPIFPGFWTQFSIMLDFSVWAAWAIESNPTPTPKILVFLFLEKLLLYGRVKVYARTWELWIMKFPYPQIPAKDGLGIT